MKKETLRKIGFAVSFAILAIWIIATTIISALSFREVYGAQWTHIADKCNYWATGDDWIIDNCRPEGEGENITLVCNLIIEDREYTAPLSIINISKVKSCRSHDKIFVYTKGPATGINEIFE